MVPVSTPNDTAEPQLLSMSPEQVGEREGRGRAAAMHPSPRPASSCPAPLVLSSRHLHPPLPTHPPASSFLLQAEETAAKLRELETDMLLSRQEARRGGWTLCGCLVIQLASATLPDHLRVWEQNLF